jgi:hypothetical protein
MMAAYYPTKSSLKLSIGKALNYGETSMFGAEYRANGSFCVVGPSETKRVWYASVTMQDDKIVKVT